MHVVEGVVAISPYDGKRSDDHDWDQEYTNDSSCGKDEPAIGSDFVFDLLPSVERIVRVEGIRHVFRCISDICGKERLEEGQYATSTEKR